MSHRNTILFSFLWLGLAQIFSQDYQIDYLSVRDGLSQNEVNSIIQDKYGFMWFGTIGGLNRYDGYEFKHFKPTINKGKSLHNPSIESLYSDRDSNIWIGTKAGGFCMYDIKKEKFVFPVDSIQKGLNRITVFHEDDNKNLWIGSWANGVIGFNKKNKSSQTLYSYGRVNCIESLGDSLVFFGWVNGLECIKNDTIDFRFRFSSTYHEITNMVTDTSDAFLWLVGWKTNLVRYNYNDRTYKRYVIPTKDGDGKIDTYSILKDDQGNIWVGTWGNGLYRFDTVNESFVKIDIRPKDQQYTNINYDVILDLYQDSSGNIWCGTNGGGVVKLSPKSKFKTLSQQPDRPINKNDISAVIVDQDGSLWVGTKGNGLFYQANGKKAELVGFQTNDPIVPNSPLVVRYIHQDSNGLVWVSVTGGLFVVREVNGRPLLTSAAQYFNSPDLGELSKVEDIHFRGDEMWIGTKERGLKFYTSRNGGYHLKRTFVASKTEKNLHDTQISSVFSDKDNQLWIATYGGLVIYQERDSNFVQLKEVLHKESQRPVCNIVLCSHVDQNRLIWYGTPCGLNKLKKLPDGKYKLTQYTKENGLADDYINAILSDDNGNIWVSTNAGISQLVIQTETFRNYDSSDGVGSLNFSTNACFKSKNGLMYFGGYSDLTFFDPKDIHKNTSSPPVMITSFKVMNKSVEINDKSLLKVNINEVDELVLSHKEPEFSFEFTSLDFKAPERNQYAYKLEGRDSSFIMLGNRRFISFSNIKPGKYTLHLKGTNSNGVWSNYIHTLNIKINPAPWKTWWAIIIYIFLIMFIVFMIVTVGKEQEKLKSEAKQEKQNRQRDREVHEYKLRFFTNISHELRTPLTLILGPVNELVNSDLVQVSRDFISNKVDLINYNTNRLYTLVNQLLEFRKAEAGKIQLQARSLNIVDYLKKVCKTFDSLAASKGISFEKNYKVRDAQIYVDDEKLRIVMNNLLSNAFKFAGDPGYVNLEVYDTDSELLIQIVNDGKGIQNNVIPHLFERFYQGGDTGLGSSGIGLALVKNYVELHKGTVSVESELNQKTCFTITLKKGRDHLDTTEMVDTVADQSVENMNSGTVFPVKRSRTVNKGTTGASILVVDDNEEIRAYLSNLLMENYSVTEAVNGDEAMKIILENTPNLVISDVMMPVMDGYELCHNIKSNERLAHIPVMLLTAKGASQDQLFGIRKGADAYLTKPFDPILLLEKVKQLIASRKVMYDTYAKKVKLEPLDKELSVEEGNFLRKAVGVIEKFIADPNLDPDKLGDEMAMSTSTLYRKIKRFTNQTTGELIRSIRMKKAAQLLVKTDLTVSEISERVGYRDLKTFRKNFSEIFEVTPIEYRKKQ